MSALARPQDSQPAPATDDGRADLVRACKAVMAPLARLAVARGLRHGELDELLRAAFVEAARDAHADVLPHRAVSRVSAATGLNRREVARLMRATRPDAPRRSLATELFTRWLSDPALRHRGQPIGALHRQGPPPSFESLAQSVTKDIHPRTLLEEVCRLGLARFDETRDVVVLLRDTFVPEGDQQRLLGFLAANVGDHLNAAVSNVLNDKPGDEPGRTPRHLEQALFASELSQESLARLRPVVKQQWQQVLQDLAPVVQKFIDEDEAADRPRQERLRVGMYAYGASMDVGPPRDERGGTKSAMNKESGRRRRNK